MGIKAFSSVTREKKMIGYFIQGPCVSERLTPSVCPSLFVKAGALHARGSWHPHITDINSTLLV